MGRQNGHRLLVYQPLQQSDGQRRTLLRIGPRTELVEQNQAVGLRRLPGLFEAQQPSTEGGAVGEQVLLVPHHRHHPREQRQTGAGRDRHR